MQEKQEEEEVVGVKESHPLDGGAQLPEVLYQQFLQGDPTFSTLPWVRRTATSGALGTPEGSLQQEWKAGVPSEAVAVTSGKVCSSHAMTLGRVKGLCDTRESLRLTGSALLIPTLR